MPTSSAASPKSSCTYCQEILKSADLSSSSDASSSASLLFYNLKQFGWSPVSMKCSSSSSLLLSSPPTHDEIVNVFSSSSTTKQERSRFTYIAAESGASGKEGIEPKQSLELKLSNAISSSSSSSSTSNSSLNDKVMLRVDDWCLALQEIAKRVCELLELPPCLSSSSSSRTNSLDLMRVFYYCHGTNEDQLGSSPHTDWGSWTVVWQDHVGGLETYCRACNRWIPVPTPPASRSTTWNCIVHVGDMASLALQPGVKQQQQQQQQHEEEQQQSNEDFSYHYVWPSPKHRVVLSSQERTSLVYFGYPPANTSIRQIKQKLQEQKTKWITAEDSQTSHSLPLSEYYLLQDQSSTTTTTTTKKEQEQSLFTFYESIESMPIEKVIQEKWKQVQRQT